jgi:fatty acid desaturase
MRSVALALALVAVAPAWATVSLPKLGAVRAAPARAGPLSKRLRVRIDDDWLDLSRWRAAHPAGEHWIDLFNEQDASEVFHAFHSVDTREKMMPRLPRVRDAAELAELEANCAPVSQLTRDFREWRAQLEADGWWKREPLAEAATLGLWLLAVALGVTFSWSSVPLVSTAAAVATLATANTMAGWLAHDFIHGKDRFCELMRPFGCLCAGMSATWWSDKHNLHHAVTNEVGVDEDLMVDPALWLWPPNEGSDKPWRRWQHRYLALPFSLLFHLWRFDSATTVWARRHEPKVASHEILPLLLHYPLLLAACAFSVPKLLAAISLSSLFTAVIVTVSHQSEQLFFERQSDWIAAQLRSTRDSVSSNPFSEWVWGGMNYQLEHHLFPTMPRSKYPRLAPLLREWCEARGVEYRVDDELAILVRNWQMYRAIAQAPVDPDAPFAKAA